MPTKRVVFIRYPNRLQNKDKSRMFCAHVTAGNLELAIKAASLQAMRSQKGKDQGKVSDWSRVVMVIEGHPVIMAIGTEL